MSVVLHLVQERQQLRLQAWIITSCGHERVPLVRSTPNEDAVRPSSDIPEPGACQRCFPRELPGAWRKVSECCGGRGSPSSGPDEEVSVTQRCAALGRRELGEPLSHLAYHRQVAFAPVAVERLVEHRGNLVATASPAENSSEIAERVTLEVEPVRPLDDRDCLARERFSVRLLATVGRTSACT